MQNTQCRHHTDGPITAKGSSSSPEKLEEGSEKDGEDNEAYESLERWFDGTTGTIAQKRRACVGAPTKAARANSRFGIPRFVSC